MEYSYDKPVTTPFDIQFVINMNPKIYNSLIRDLVKEPFYFYFIDHKINDYTTLISPNCKLMLYVTKVFCIYLLFKLK